MTGQLIAWIREPRVINIVQIIAYAIAAIAGLLAALGGVPTIITGTVGPVMSVAVGSLLVLGGIIGAFSVCTGLWGWERVALLITGLGFTLLLLVTLWFAFTSKTVNSTIWLIVALEVIAVADNIKRYRRIDWAYLDPMK